MFSKSSRSLILMCAALFWGMDACRFSHDMGAVSMADEFVIECDCGRRYMRTSVPLDTPASGFERCLCEQKLGEWSGLVRYEFEPENDGD
jgi:hypothetical protein